MFRKYQMNYSKKILGKLMPLKLFNGEYGVTDDGNIYSFEKKVGNRIYPAKWLNTRLRKDGYIDVNIRKKNYSVHRLVAIAFLNNSDNKKCVNHKNGIKNDNRVENLEWTTHSENTKHSYNDIKTQSYSRLSNIGKIQSVKNIKVSELIAKEIYKEYFNSKTSYRKLAKKYNFSKTTIERIITGKGQMYFTNKLIDEVEI